MIMPRSVFLPVLDYEIHVTEWGIRSNPAIVMWHGLARTGRDFDELARGLADRYFVICPDTIGRGLSSWDDQPKIGYSLNNYCALALGIMDRYDLPHVHWLGTSMGGQIGMQLASGAHADRIASLIINDIGPELPGDAVERILSYASDLPVFQTISEAEEWLRNVYSPFGPASDTFWRRMAKASVRRVKSGRFTLHYDPNLVSELANNPDVFDSWESYEQITAPTHLIWGQSSDILTKNIVSKMENTGPMPRVTMYRDCGHAPTLSRKKDINNVRKILEGFSALQMS